MAAEFFRIKCPFLSRDIVFVEGPDGKPWAEFTFFRALGYRDAHNAVRYLDKSDVSHIYPLNSRVNRGRPGRTIISESGLYQLLMTSRAAEVKPFKEWLADVCVQIRKTGRYEVAAATSELMVQRVVQSDENDPLLLECLRVVDLRRAQLRTEREVEDLQIKQLRLTREVEESKEKLAVLTVAEEKFRVDIERVHQDVTLNDTAFQLVRWARTRGIYLNKNEESREGKMCAAISRSMGHDPVKRRTSNYPGGVNLYEEEVLVAWESQYLKRMKAISSPNGEVAGL